MHRGRELQEGTTLMWNQVFAMGVFTGLMLGFLIFLGFLFYCIRTEGRYKSEMQERTYP